MIQAWCRGGFPCNKEGGCEVGGEDRRIDGRLSGNFRLSSVWGKRRLLLGGERSLGGLLASWLARWQENDNDDRQSAAQSESARLANYVV